MNISFTGIRNASFAYYTDDTDKNSKMRFLNTQLKDDEFGNDLTAYKNLIAKFKEYRNPYYSNFVNIITINNHGTRVVQMNGIIVPETDEYLPLFSFIGKLAKKISKMPEEKFVTDKKYLESDYVDKAVLFDKSLSKEMRKPLSEIISKFHNPKGIKNCAQKIDNDVYCCMMDYFG